MSSWQGGKTDARNHLNLQSPYGLLTIQVIPMAIKANGNYRKLVALLFGLSYYFEKMDLQKQLFPVVSFIRVHSREFAAPISCCFFALRAAWRFLSLPGGRRAARLTKSGGLL